MRRAEGCVAFAGAAAKIAMRVKCTALMLTDSSSGVEKSAAS